MGGWIVSADTLAASRFVISPLAETTASLMALHRRLRRPIPAKRPGWTPT